MPQPPLCRMLQQLLSHMQQLPSPQPHLFHMGTEEVSQSADHMGRSDGLLLTGYFLLGCDGKGAWHISRIVCALLPPLWLAASLQCSLQEMLRCIWYLSARWSAGVHSFWCVHIFQREIQNKKKQNYIYIYVCFVFVYWRDLPMVRALNLDPGGILGLILGTRALHYMTLLEACSITVGSCLDNCWIISR